MAVTSTTPRSVRIGGRRYPVTGPSARDPRLQLAAVILTLQVLGQTSFGFTVSISQILAAVVTAAVVEVGLTMWRRQRIAWPASALLTGSSVAFILRVTGTQHGDWWSLHGVWIFAATAAVSVLSKWVIRVGDRHVFNPSNFGLVACFVLLGSSRVTPLDLWWARPGPALALALAVIVVGGLVIVTRLGMLRVAVSFWATFAVTIGILAASGHGITTRWHVGIVDGRLFWTTLVTSPEILLFVFFMITDPRTAPRGRVAQVLYGCGVAVVATLLAAPQTTEFGTKVAILGALAVVCVLRFPLERLVPAAGTAGDDPLRWSLGDPPAGRRTPAPRTAALRVVGGLAAAGTVAVLVVVAGIPARSEASTPAGTVAGRPAVRVTDAELPPVTVVADPTATDAPIGGRQARAIARDVVADLEITRRAELRRDPRLAATAGTGAWLTQVRLKIEVADQTGRVDVDTYRFDRMRIVVRRARTWSPPQLADATRGTVERRTYAVNGAAGRPALVAAAATPEQRTFLVVARGGHYLLADALAP